MVRTNRKKSISKANAPEPKNLGKTELLAWRKATIDQKTGKSITQQRVSDLLADKGIEFSRVSVLRMEKGEQEYKQSVLEGLRDIYGVEPAVLIARGPNQADQTDKLLRAWGAIHAQYREKALMGLTVFANLPPLKNEPSPHEKPSRKQAHRKPAHPN